MSVDPAHLAWHENMCVGLETLTAERDFPPFVVCECTRRGGGGACLAQIENWEILARCDSVMVKSEGDIFGGTSCVPFKLRALYRHVVSLYKAMREMISSLSLPILYLFITGNLEATCRNVRLALKRKLPHSMVPAFLVLDVDELPSYP
jgi:hypothetical protein